MNVTGVIQGCLLPTNLFIRLSCPFYVINHIERERVTFCQILNISPGKQNSASRHVSD